MHVAMSQKGYTVSEFQSGREVSIKFYEARFGQPTKSRSHAIQIPETGTSNII